MRCAKIPAIFSIVTGVGCVVIRKCILMALDSRFTFCENNAFLTMHSFFVLFSFQFHEAPIMISLKIFELWINIRFVSRVCSPMLSISKLSYQIKNANFSV